MGTNPNPTSPKKLQKEELKGKGKKHRKARGNQKTREDNLFRKGILFKFGIFRCQREIIKKGYRGEKMG